MGYFEGVANVVPGLQNENSTLYLTPGCIDLKFVGAIKGSSGQGLQGVMMSKELSEALSP